MYERKGQIMQLFSLKSVLQYISGLDSYSIVLVINLWIGTTYWDIDETVRPPTKHSRHDANAPNHMTDTKVNHDERKMFVSRDVTMSFDRNIAIRRVASRAVANIYSTVNFVLKYLLLNSLCNRHIEKCFILKVVNPKNECYSWYIKNIIFILIMKNIYWR